MGDDMRVLYDYQIMLNQKYGGISRYFSQLAKYINSDMSDAEALVPLEKSQNYYFSNVCEPNISSPNRWHVLVNCFATYKTLFLSKLKNKRIDIVHPTYYFPSYLYLLPKSLRKFKVVITVHDLIREKFYPDMDNASMGRRRGIIKNADAVIAISENTKRDLLEMYPEIDSDKVFVVYHGIDVNGSKNCTPVSVNGPYLLFVGKRDYYKNGDRYIQCIGELAKEYPNLSFVFVGGGAFTHDEKILINDLEIKNRTVQINANDEELNYLYHNALCFVFPSLYEGFGIPILEAFSCGCPVALSNCSCFPEIAGDAAAYFDGESVPDMLKVLEDIIDDEIYRDKLISLGSEKVKEYTLEKMVTNTMKVYESVIG
ncbi:MAG: glycosyltransferase family 4 protein [Lachnospiraceae bacterium]|nr:glycosyltransferase family 4 protein [Lachnospiraceae bacterium]